MNVHISDSSLSLGQAAGTAAATIIRNAISNNGQANIILATGTSQFETLKQLITEKNIDWSKVVMFHLDEYIGLPLTHPASFRKYLQERFVSKIPSLEDAVLIDGEADPEKECIRLNKYISQFNIDVALVGIGENGHLAFNDPPADFDMELPYIIVELDEACRAQQMGEGWFKKIEDVPHLAISMSVKQFLKSKNIICSVPDQRKAMAVKNSLEQEVSNFFPASILQLHSHCEIYLDNYSSSLLSAEIKHQ
ncbi:MAG: glucosamine-6-phosphate deaminase [Chitinophagaceae bacterium]